MLPRPSTTMSFHGLVESSLRSACLTKLPSLSRRSSEPPEMASNRPSGSRSMQDKASTSATTSARPARSSAMISPTSPLPQSATSSRSSCQRGDSRRPRSSSSTRKFDMVLTLGSSAWCICNPNRQRRSCVRRLAAGIAQFVSGRRTAWVILVLAVVVGGAVIAFSGAGQTTDDRTAGLPDSAQSTRVAELQRQLPSGQLNPALVVYSRTDAAALSPGDLAAIAEQAPALRNVALDGRVSPLQPSPNGKAALVVVPLSASVSSAETVESVELVRSIVKSDLPPGVIAQVTGGAGFTADLNSAFEGADARLLITTAAVVAVLLLITYRSPILWLVPLAVVGLADQVTASLIKITSRNVDLPFDASTSGIVSVLVFGAGTDYLLLIARYREELRRESDRRLAMRLAWLGAAPSIAASGVTVILALLTLLLAQSGGSRAIGLGGAIGIAVAMIYGLLVLPAALVVCPRGI